MHSRRRYLRSARSQPRRAALQAVVGIIALIGSLVVAVPASAVSGAPGAVSSASSLTEAATVDSGFVKAAAVVGFNPENIISDALFYDGNAMSAAEIQSFLDSKIGRCENGKCLNVLTASISSRDAWYSQATGDLVCSALQGGTMRVSELIYRVQVACGISAKVILVTLQKEQGLTTSSAPSDWNLRAAMGASCPDTEPCDPAYSGVGPQIVQGVRQLKIYKAGRFAKQPGVNFIGYNPNSGCGGTNLNIQNFATAALYNYTPYQPNAASLAAGWGLGDGCSSYGNRNFYNYYTSWFGSTQATVDPCRAPDPSTITSASGEVVTTDDLNGRAAPTTACSPIVTVFPKGTVLTRLGTLNGWTNVRLNGTTYWVSSDYLAQAPAATFTTDRVQGADRYETAAAIAAKSRVAAGGTVFLVSGETFADSVIGATIAARTSSALLLTTSTVLPDATAKELAALKPARVVVLGGTEAISAGIADAAQRVVGSAARVDRIAGADRYETARLVVKSGWTAASTVYVAAGATFPDALSATSVAATQGAPVLLVDGQAGQLPAETTTLLKQLGVKKLIVAGGPQAVSTSIDAQMSALGVDVRRVSGDDRYATSLALAASIYSSTVPGLFMASGEAFPDALAGAVLAAGAASPLLLQPSSCMTSDAKNFAISHGTSRITLLGGPAALSNDVAAAVRC